MGKKVDEFLKEYKIKVMKNDTLIESGFIRSSQDIYDYAMKIYDDTMHVIETSVTLFLNRANKVIGFARISTGGIDHCLIDKRVVIKYAFDTMSIGVALIHNHPSGNLEPSRYDNAVTTEIKKALDVCGIEFLDHIIISDSGFFSYHDKGLI